MYIRQKFNEILRHHTDGTDLKIIELCYANTLQNITCSTYIILYILRVCIQQSKKPIICNIGEEFTHDLNGFLDNLVSESMYAHNNKV